MDSQYSCKNDLRRAIVRDARDGNGDPILNGIDYLEVTSADERTLTVYFLQPLPGESGGFPASPVLTRQNILISGGVRITGIQVETVLSTGNALQVTVNSAGDYSTYRLRLVASASASEPPVGFDRQLAEVEFSFKVDCPSDFDCAPEQDCPPEPLEEPPLDYLSKDYASFRQLMLDRLAIILPDWQERNAADLGVALVETLAYAADQLSYYQDAVANEAYLGTARRRVSIRRHARLLDYPMHEGCNARAWVQVQVDQDAELESGAQLLTRVDGIEQRIEADSQAYLNAVNHKPEFFETLHSARLFAAHNELHFYTWGDSDCCLPKGATRATLLGELPDLAAGDVLVFEEVRGPQSGLQADADPAHRQAVRLIYVQPAQDLLGGQFLNPPQNSAVDVTEIQWRLEDALTFPLCLSARSGTGFFEDISLARGNIVLADHGRTFTGQELDPETAPLQGRYRPRLARTDITQRVPYNHTAALARPAKDALIQDPRAALPAVMLSGGGETWEPQRDLLASDRFAAEFVVEVEEDGRASLRFGDDVHGRIPVGGVRLNAAYRTGNGTAGNIGSDALYHIVSADSRLTGVRNPLPAQGGTQPEPSAQVQLYAPQAFRTQERAVTAEDYASMAQRHPEVQKAVATLRWTGSWRTVYVTVDRKGGRAVTPEFKSELRALLEKYRLAGHDLEIDTPRYVPLDIALTVCLAPGYTRSAVKQALLEAFSRGDLPGGGRGFFHPDNLTFGQTIYLSQLVAGAMQVEGVQWVEVTRFQRWGRPPDGELDDGFISLGRLEIARLDNDPSAPENGRLEFLMEGGV